MSDTGNCTARINQGTSTIISWGLRNVAAIPGLSAGNPAALDQRAYLVQAASPSAATMKTWVVGVNWWMTAVHAAHVQLRSSRTSVAIRPRPHDLNRHEPRSRPKERLRRGHDQRLRHARAS